MVDKDYRSGGMYLRITDGEPIDPADIRNSLRISSLAGVASMSDLYDGVDRDKVARLAADIVLQKSQRTLLEKII